MRYSPVPRACQPLPGHRSVLLKFWHKLRYWDFAGFAVNVTPALRSSKQSLPAQLRIHTRPALQQATGAQSRSSTAVRASAGAPCRVPSPRRQTLRPRGVAVIALSGCCSLKHRAGWPAAEPLVAVVTGSSRGIGKAIALALGAQGARVRLGSSRMQWDAQRFSCSGQRHAGISQ